MEVEEKGLFESIDDQTGPLASVRHPLTRLPPPRPAPFSPDVTDQHTFKRIMQIDFAIVVAVSTRLDAEHRCRTVERHPLCVPEKTCVVRMNVSNEIERFEKKKKKENRASRVCEHRSKDEINSCLNILSESLTRLEKES